MREESEKIWRGLGATAKKYRSFHYSIYLFDTRGVGQWCTKGLQPCGASRIEEDLKWVQ